MFSDDFQRNSEQEDLGVYYVLDHGVLRNPLIERYRPVGKKSRISSEGRQESNLNKSDVSTNGHLSKPTTLLSLCITFVAQNVDFVDSLVGFPDLVGKAIFDAVIPTGALDLSSCKCRRIVSLFVDAYGDAILHDLNLHANHFVLEQHTELWSTFKDLRRLNLAGCQVGDDSEILSLIGQLGCLTHLNLENNLLSDLGIQRLTSPLRVLQKGPIELECFDLSCNPAITDGALRFLKSFGKLQFLDLTGSSVTKTGIQRFLTITSLEKCIDAADMKAQCSFKTKGWAAEVVDKWTTCKPQKPTPKDPASGSGLKTNFYRRSASKAASLPIHQKREHSENMSGKPKIWLKASTVKNVQCVSVKNLHREKSDITGSSEKSSDYMCRSSHSKHSPRSRKHSFLSNAQTKSCLPEDYSCKTRSTSDKEMTDSDDLDLISSYTNCKDMSTGKLTLWQALDQC